MTIVFGSIGMTSAGTKLHKAYHRYYKSPREFRTKCSNTPVEKNFFTAYRQYDLTDHRIMIFELMSRSIFISSLCNHCFDLEFRLKYDEFFSAVMD